MTLQQNMCQQVCEHHDAHCETNGVWRLLSSRTTTAEWTRSFSPPFGKVDSPFSTNGSALFSLLGDFPAVLLRALPAATFILHRDSTREGRRDTLVFSHRQGFTTPPSSQAPGSTLFFCGSLSFTGAWMLVVRVKQ